MKTSIRTLRNSMKLILDAVQQGETVTIYSHRRPIAKIIPFEKNFSEKNHEGFGMWKNDKRSVDVNHFARQLREGRKYDD